MNWKTAVSLVALLLVISLIGAWQMSPRVLSVEPAGKDLFSRQPVTITKMNAKGLTEADVVFTNADGIVVLEAALKGNVPGESEREVLNRMMEEGDPTNPLGDEYQGNP